MYSDVGLKCGDKDSLFAFMLGDVSGMNNQTACYKGRLPQYDNEIAISGKFASDQVADLQQTKRVWYLQGAGLHLRQLDPADCIKLYALRYSCSYHWICGRLLRHQPVPVICFAIRWPDALRVPYSNRRRDDDRYRNGCCIVCNCCFAVVQN